MPPRLSLSAVLPGARQATTCSRLPLQPLIRSRLPTLSPPAPTRPATRNFLTSAPRRARYERFDRGPSPEPGPNPSGRKLYGYVRQRLGGDRAVLVYGVGIGGSLIYYVLHLERVEETGRLRFLDVNEAQEKEMGVQSQLQTLSEYSGRVYPPNHPVTKRVRRVAKRIVESSGLGRMKEGGEMGAVEGKVQSWGGGEDVSAGDILFRGGSDEIAKAKEDVEWEVYVIDDPKTKNAFVLPGGKIFVFTGILPVSANDDGLATILGHEVAHQVARHGAERMSSLKVFFAIGFLLETLGLDIGVTRLLLTFLLQLPNSRKSESEADFIGLRLMARACFDPSESTRMWERMSQADGGAGGNIDFMSTHPANAKRIKQLTQWLPEAERIRESSPCGSTGSQFGGFLDALKPARF